MLRRLPGSLISFALKMSPYCKYNACPLFAERTLNRFLFISITETIIKQQHHIPVKTDMLIILLTHIDILSDSISSRGTSIPIKPRKAYIPPVTVEAIFAI